MKKSDIIPFYHILEFKGNYSTYYMYDDGKNKYQTYGNWLRKSDYNKDLIKI